MQCGGDKVGVRKSKKAKVKSKNGGVYCQWWRKVLLFITLNIGLFTLPKK
jgi:hypothetical protein